MEEIMSNPDGSFFIDDEYWNKYCIICIDYNKNSIPVAITPRGRAGDTSTALINLNYGIITEKQARAICDLLNNWKDKS